jgi:hypothetical protein
LEEERRRRSGGRVGAGEKYQGRKGAYEALPDRKLKSASALKDHVYHKICCKNLGRNICFCEYL